MILKFTLFLSLTLFAAACTNNDASHSDSQTKGKSYLKPAEELEDVHVETLKAGEGLAAKVGQKLEVRYQAWVYDPQQPEGKGKRFDGTEASGSNFHFVLGKDEVMQAWDEGLIGIKPGEVRKLIVPARLAYGKHGAGRSVPPHSAIIYEIELVSLQYKSI